MIPLPPPPPPPPPPAEPPKKRGGPGRPPGRKNNATLLKEAAMEAAMNAVTAKGGEDVTALQYLQAIYRDERLPVEVRMRAAALAGSLETPRPTPIPPPKDDGPLAKRMEEALRRTGRLPPRPERSEAERDAAEAELREMLGLP